MQTYKAISPLFAMRIESSEDRDSAALDESVEAALFDLRATVGPRRGVMRRNGESGIVDNAR